MQSKPGRVRAKDYCREQGAILRQLCHQEQLQHSRARIPCAFRRQRNPLGSLGPGRVDGAGGIRARQYAPSPADYGEPAGRDDQGQVPGVPERRREGREPSGLWQVHRRGDGGGIPGGAEGYLLGQAGGPPRAEDRIDCGRGRPADVAGQPAGARGRGVGDVAAAHRVRRAREARPGLQAGDAPGDQGDGHPPRAQVAAQLPAGVGVGAGRAHKHPRRGHGGGAPEDQDAHQVVAPDGAAAARGGGGDR
mmetsp:Transcript_25235/g.60061  ORF Transcript_25235/g.60061 Transcript_25235/m.60061 type:complete len:249 (-) Transcript_25235:112-858(-)